MKIAIACDHAAADTKNTLAAHLTELGHEITDCGTDGATSVDYPDFALKAVALVQSGDAERAILICGTGIGMSMSANKARGIRAALVSEAFSARMCREHNDANVLCLGGRVTGPELIRECAEVFISTAFEGGRHERRVGKIMAIEEA